MILLRFHSHIYTEIPFSDGGVDSTTDNLDVCVQCLGRATDPNFIEWAEEHWSEENADAIRYAGKVTQLGSGACSICRIDKTEDERAEAGHHTIEGTPEPQ